VRKQTVRAMYAEAAELDDDDKRKKLTSWAIASESEARLQAAVNLARTERAVIVDPNTLDGDPWLFNAANGTIDLRTGELREHRREDLLTRLTLVVYQPGARSERWDSFLERVTGGNAELADFLQRAGGYSLTGHTSEEVLFFAHGPTATGKSSQLEALKAVLGEYAATADFETFLKRRGDAGIRNDIARLAGARFVVSIEVDDGKALAEGLLKLLTGGDTVAARFLYRETFEFQPQFKLWLAANERPRVSADDEAVWRRILQLPFTQVIPEAERDERVKIELRTNPDVQSAILAWAVKGCLEWQRIGLAVPACVRDYTAEYRAENDPLRDWIGDSCELDPAAWTSNAKLRKSYEEWCETNGEKPLAAKKLGTLLEAKGYHAEKSAGERGRRGIRVH
jgi:putative DNA primase/helicase